MPQPNNTRRRVPFNITLPLETIQALTSINPNRSAAVEQLVKEYLAKRQRRSPTVTA